MKKPFWLIVFIVALCADILFMQFNNSSLRIISKPLIVFSLLVYFILQTTLVRSAVKILVIAGLIFSLAGDVFLLFEDKAPDLFMVGLISFLIAHICYIIAFNRLRAGEKIRFKLVLILPVLIYYVSLIAVLFTHLDAMKIPVIIYGFAISLMLGMAIHLTGVKNKRTGLLLFFGAALFILSDSMLAFNKFYQPFENAGSFIMASYGLAQLFIIFSTAKLIEAKENAASTGIFAQPQTN